MAHIGSQAIFFLTRLSIHHTAALVIARRFFRFSEKSPSCMMDIPDGKGGHIASPLPVGNRGEHVIFFERTMTDIIGSDREPKFRRKRLNECNYTGHRACLSLFI